MGRVRAAVALGLLVGVVALAFALSRSPTTVLATSTTKDMSVGVVHDRTEACQAGETLPQGTSAVRLTMNAFTGPRVAVEVLQHGQAIARGERGSGWTAGAVTVAVEPLASARSGVTLCYAFYLNGNETGYLSGERTPPAIAAVGPNGPFPGRIRAEYLQSSGPTWWSLAGEVARRMGLGRAASGTWIVLAVLVLMAGVVVLCIRMALALQGPG
jgi:hypothetical protein